MKKKISSLHVKISTRPLLFRLNFQHHNIVVSLSGRIDKILRVDGTLIVQDDKFVAKPHVYDSKTQPYPGQLLQVLTYLNSDLFLKEKGQS